MYVNEVKGHRSLARSNFAVVYSCCYFLVCRSEQTWEKDMNSLLLYMQVQSQVPSGGM